MIKVTPKHEADWYFAVSTKLEVSGFGKNKKEALEALKRSIRSYNKVRKFIKE
tara:strand:+ start:7454 stop:7612 length:159 start_codon:yes stop_codon:yes gene_type:complete